MLNFDFRRTVVQEMQERPVTGTRYKKVGDHCYTRQSDGYPNVYFRIPQNGKKMLLKRTDFF